MKAGTTTIDKAALGGSLSNHPYLDYLEAPDLETLRAQLSSIKLPFSIVAIYFDGKNHVAWVNPSRTLIKVVKGNTSNGTQGM